MEKLLNINRPQATSDELMGGSLTLHRGAGSPLTTHREAAGPLTFHRKFGGPLTFQKGAA